MSWDWHRLFLYLVNVCLSRTEGTNLLLLLFFKCFSLKRYFLCFILLPNRSYPSPSYYFFFLILFAHNWSNSTYFWCPLSICFFINSFFSSNSRRLNLIGRRLHIHTQNFRLILNILLQEGFVNIKLLSSIDQEYLFSTLVKALIELAIDEILDGGFGLHHKMGQSFSPLQPLDVDVQPLSMHPVEVNHMHDVLLRHCHLLLTFYLLTLEKHHYLLGLDSKTIRYNISQIVVVHLFTHTDVVGFLLAVSEVYVDVLGSGLGRCLRLIFHLLLSKLTL